jgi:predicted metal-dependent phosphoesterase TrpH
LKREKRDVFGDWLLCDFHVHASFSDGELPLAKVIDLYGNMGFDVIAVTDHVLDRRTVEGGRSEGIQPQGAIAVACHPYKRNGVDHQQSRYLWENHDRFSGLFDAWEVANRDDLFNVVGLKKFRYIANSDFHSEQHIYSWKTLLMCEKTPEAIKTAIRDNDRVAIYLFRDQSPMNSKNKALPNISRN